MNYISLFSGIEAASCAWEHLNWQPLAFSEIDPFPSAVLAHHFPHVPNLGDITQIDWSSYAGTVDIIVGGSPCQSFSTAGSRTGLSGESALMFEYIRAVQEVMPNFFIWENVEGALQSENGAAFQCLLRNLDQFGYGMAWRVLDAQFFGVAQRRRRVFLVGVLGNLASAAEILFEREGLCWDYPSSRAKRAQLTRAASFDFESRCERLSFDINSLTSKVNRSNPQPGDPTPTLTCATPPLVTYGIAGNIIGREVKNGGNHTGVSEEIGFTLTTADRHGIAICMADGNANAAIDYDLCGTLHVGGDPPIINIPQIRKLTPLECERLQGFPDNWTNIQFKNKPASDAVRYKALGNSMAVPVMRWIGERLQRVASL